MGTVLHSLDHTLMGWHCEDPLWLDIDHPRLAVHKSNFFSARDA